MRKSNRQLGFADALVEQVSKPNMKLDRIERLVDWRAVEALLRPLRSAPTGRPGYQPLPMLKALLLQQWYGLSDPGLEEALADRLSFRRFLGVSLQDETPDHTTLWRFREDLVRLGLAERVFAAIARQFEQNGLVLRQGTLIDATLIPAAVRPSGSAEQPSDPDAAFARRAGEPGSTFGFKAHVAMDKGSGLVRAAVLTPANVNETTVADRLVQGDEAAVYADMAYDSKARRVALKRRGIKDRIMHRPNKHHPVLAPWPARRNRLIARVRGRVETAFAVAKWHYGWRRARYRGLPRNQAHLHLLCTAINLRRAIAITA